MVIVFLVINTKGTINQNKKRKASVKLCEISHIDIIYVCMYGICIFKDVQIYLHVGLKRHGIFPIVK